MKSGWIKRIFAAAVKAAAAVAWSAAVLASPAARAADIAGATISGIGNIDTGGTLAPVLTFNGTTLVEGVDYTWQVIGTRSVATTNHYADVADSAQGGGAAGFGNLVNASLQNPDYGSYAGWFVGENAAAIGITGFSGSTTYGLYANGSTYPVSPNAEVTRAILHGDTLKTISVDIGMMWDNDISGSWKGVEFLDAASNIVFGVQQGGGSGTVEYYSRGGTTIGNWSTEYGTKAFTVTLTRTGSGYAVGGTTRTGGTVSGIAVTSGAAIATFKAYMNRTDGEEKRQLYFDNLRYETVETGTSQTVAPDYASVPGEYTAVFTGKGGYTGTLQRTFTVLERSSIAGATVNGIAGPYTENQFSLSPGISINGTALVEGRDFTWAVWGERSGIATNAYADLASVSRGGSVEGFGDLEDVSSLYDGHAGWFTGDAAYRAGITGFTDDTSYGLYANGSYYPYGASPGMPNAEVRRTIGHGDLLTEISVDIGLMWDSQWSNSFRGVEFLDADGTIIFGLIQGGSATVSYYGKEGVMLGTWSEDYGTQVFTVRLTRRAGGYTAWGTTRTGEEVEGIEVAADADIAAFKAYMNWVDWSVDNMDKCQLYFDNLRYVTEEPRVWREPAENYEYEPGVYTAVFTGTGDFGGETEKAFTVLEGPRPDFVPSWTSCPGTLRPGEEATFAWTVTNAGTAAASGEWTEELWLTNSAGRLRVAATNVSGTLAAGAVAARSLTAAMPEYPAVVGQVWAVVKANAGGDVAEMTAREGNNEASRGPVEMVGVLDNGVLLHAGPVGSNETWKAGTVHLVTATVTVPKGRTLVIEPGAVVKFMDGTELAVAKGGICVAKGAVFTHVADDTVGGDTMGDGSATVPEADKYRVTGAVTTDAATEMRWVTVHVSGTLSGANTWPGHRTYRVTANLTVAAGATLAIGPGAVVKFDDGVALTVAAGGTLDAIGTRAEPIVFTGVKDDSAGGDTNGDGDATAAQPGDWGGVLVSGGRIRAEYCRFLNGGGVDGNEYHARACVFMWNDASGTFDGCRFAGSPMDGCFAQNATFRNCVFTDCDRGLVSHTGTIAAINCVAALNRIGFFAHTTPLSAVNSVSSLNGEKALDGDYASCETRRCYVGDAPKFLDAERGDFRLQAGSPCIDAGDGAAAPERDWWGQPRMDVAEVPDTGTPAANGAVPDIGIHEFLPRIVASDVDLAVAGVDAPAAMTVGETVEVSWTVKNQGVAAAAGPWTDAVELVGANGAAVTLGRVRAAGTLPAGGERAYRGSFTVPAAAMGRGHVRVTANADRDLFEGTLTANNVGESGAVEVDLPELALAGGATATLEVAAGAATAFRVPDGAAPGGGVLVIRTGGNVTVRTGNGVVPTADIYHAAGVQIAENTWVVALPAGAPAVYAAVENAGTDTARVEVSVTAGALLLFDTGAVSAVNDGTASLSLSGYGFADGMEVWLEKDGTLLTASEVVVADAVRATATFDVTGLAEGAWSVHVARGGNEAAAPLLTLSQKKFGPKWRCKLDVANAVRTGREYVGHIEFANDGDMPLDAPHVEVSAKDGTLIRFTTADAWGDTLELMATSATYPASRLKPGETRRIPFRYKATGSTLTIECRYTQEDPGAFPWDSNGPLMRPSWASDELWGISLAILKANVGMTWNAYLARMRANCDHLAKIGQPTWRLDRVWQLEINEALGVDHAVGTLAANTDLARSGRGFGLALSRSYGAGLYRRLKKGVFGYGWSDNYSAWAELQNSGSTLALHSGDGSTYLFERVDGKWVPEDARDKTVLTETGSEYVLKYRSGTEQRIAKSNMRVSSVKDNQGNSLAFTWNADGTLAKVSHRDGQTLTFTYANGLMVSASDDQGRTTRYEYSGELLTKATAFNGLETRYRYLPADGSANSRALRQIVYADGTTRDFTYDAEGRVATVAINGNMQMTEIVRGPLGSYSVVAPNGGETKVTVGASGEMLETVNALGQKSSRGYTTDGLLESVVGPTGKRATIGYDEDGQAVKATDAAGAETLFGYTEDFGNLATVTDARGNSFDYGYDKLGRSKSISYADGSIESIAYNDRGDVTNSVNRRGQSIAFTYDKEGNVLSKTWEDGRTFTWAYDAKGNCTNATDSVTGTVTMEYDENERLVRIVHPKGRGFAYTYDALGRTTSRTMLRGDGVPAVAQDIQRYEYDSLGRLSRMTDGDGNLYVENAYDPVTGWLVTQTYGNGTVISNAYDILGRTIGIYHGRTSSPSEPPIAFFEYAYDAEGRRISQTTAEGVERYTYDTVGQLTDVIYPDGSEEHFTYDAVGNRITANTTTYTVNNLNQYTTLRDSASPRVENLEYDLDGNMTRKGDTRYYYDIQNRLVAVTNTTTDIAWSCEYDVFGNRTKVVDHGTAKETLFVQGSLPSAVADYDASGSPTTRHILLGSVRLADITGTTGVSPVEKRYYHADGLASTRLLTDANGDAIATASYRAFGEVRTTGWPSSVSATADTEAGPPSAGWVGTLGVERDDATGLIFMRNRYYDAEQGRFIQMDPIRHQAGDVNLYRYCANDTMLSFDPIGTDQFCSIGRVGGPGAVNSCAAQGLYQSPLGNGCVTWEQYNQEMKEIMERRQKGKNGGSIFNEVKNWTQDHPVATKVVIVGGVAVVYVAVEVFVTHGAMTAAIIEWVPAGVIGVRTLQPVLVRL